MKTIKLKRTQKGVIGQLTDSLRSYDDYQKIKGLRGQYIFQEDPSGFSVYDRSEIQNGALFSESSNLIVCFIKESCQWIEQSLELFPTDKKYIFVTNGNWSKKDFDLPMDYDVASWPMHCLLQYSSAHNHPSATEFWFDKRYDFDYPKANSFLCLIGYRKEWRDSLVKTLFRSDKDLGKYLLKYNGRLIKGEQVIVNDDIMPTRITADGNLDMTPVENVDLHYVVPAKLFNHFNYSLVAETNFCDIEEFHLTEKTCRCLISGMPFVVASSYKFLDNLKSYGFKTYDGLWSEDYDSIRDGQKRLTMILELCANLATFDWKANRSKLIEIAWHNSNTFRNLQKSTLRDAERLARLLDGH